MKTRTHKYKSIQSFSNPDPDPAPAATGTGGLRPRLGARARRALAFTLVETLVATSLAAVILPALYASIAAGFAMLQVTRENLRANQIIVQRMEAIRLAPYKTLLDPTSYPTNYTDYFYPGGTTNGTAGTAYSVTYNLALPSSLMPPGYRTNVTLVTVAASWTSGKAVHTRSMQTYVARYGVQRYVSSF
jgi:type II secretory pathway pseudopilin PulG